MNPVLLPLSLLVLLCVLKLGDDLTFVASGIVMIRVLLGLLLGPLLARVAAEHGLLLVVVVVLVLVKMLLGHDGCLFWTLVANQLIDYKEIFVRRTFQLLRVSCTESIRATVCFPASLLSFPTRVFEIKPSLGCHWSAGERNPNPGFLLVGARQ